MGNVLNILRDEAYAKGLEDGIAKATPPENYQLTYSIPYEGSSSISFGSLQEVRAWINKNKSTYYFDLDNLEIIQIFKVIDVYELMGNENAS